ncbi:MAG: T9SS type A sorting domain-containing protein [Flavobacteriaceae bacterium]|nr:T9SS type A sorting domain-containing protein [Flavobacteriaceae bacterium]
MKKVLSLFLYLVLSQTQCFSQTLYGTNNYVEYQVGTLPIVISVPHGGLITPTQIPDRTCNDPTTVTDAYTIETVEQIKAALFLATGCYPHVIICNLKRTKLDCNRTIADGACDNVRAITAWNEYHNFITMAQNTANLRYNNKTLFIDLHGHGHAIQRIELGYVLSGSDLELSDATLNTTAYINQSSIKNLALNNSNNYTHAQLLRGPSSFGTLLANEGLLAVPSTQIPFPGSANSYFNGGYTTEIHTCFNPAVTTNGFQMELNYDGVRNTTSNRTLFAEKFKNVVLNYLNTHTNVVLGSCASLAIDENKESELIMYPNPVKFGSQLFIKGTTFNNLRYRIFNSLGQEITHGTVNNGNEIDVNCTLNKGIYIISILNTEGSEIKKLKLIIN